MNFRLVFKLTGKTLLVEAGALLLPLPVSYTHLYLFSLQDHERI